MQGHWPLVTVLRPARGALFNKLKDQAQGPDICIKLVPVRLTSTSGLRMLALAHMAGLAKRPGQESEPNGLCCHTDTPAPASASLKPLR